MFTRPLTRISLVLSALAVAAGCSVSPSEDAASNGEELSANRADHGCRVFLLNAGIPSHGSIDGDFNPISAVTARRDAAGRNWWPFAADVGLGASIPTGATVGVSYSVDGHTWRTVEAVQPTSSMSGVRVYHLEWGDDLIPFASGSILMCSPGSLGSCLSQQHELRPIAVEAFVRMADGTTYYDHNTTNLDTALANDMSSLHLDAGNAWQTPGRDLLHCEMPGT